MQELGFNYRITDIQCALGLSQLNKLKKIVNQRAKIAKIYDKILKSLKNLYLPQNKHRDLSSNHLYVLNLNFRKIGLTKYKFMKSLYEKGIITQVHYIPIHLHPFFKNKHKKNKFKKFFKLLQSSCKHSHFYNLTKSNQKKVINNIKKILTKRAH